MADHVTVRAGWALWSKEPGTRADYAVLASSPDPFSRAEFGTIITRFAAGTPDTRAAGPGELPWVTISWVGVDASLQVGIAVTDKTGQVDGVGRPITETSYFCVPYRELAAAGVTYAALYDAVKEVHLTPEDGAAVSLAVPVMTTEDTARHIDDFGDRIVSAAAAQLLRGPVSIVEAEGSTLAQRLDFIDAVASLLPYGFRAKFSAATWSDSGIRHRLRLSFASRPRDDAAAVSWRHPGEVPGSDNVAHAYFEQLRQLRSGSAAHGKKFDLGTVVAHLAACTEPQKFEHPQAALAILREIDLPDRVVRAVRDGAEVDLAELRQVVRPGPSRQLLPDQRDDLLAALSHLGAAEDWPVLSPWLDELQDLGRCYRVLARFGKRVLWGSEPDDAVLRDALAKATARGIDDDVLASLTLPPGQALRSPEGVQYAAALLAGRVLADSSDGAAYPVTREALVSSPLAVAAYLAALADSGVGAEEFLNWLGSRLRADVAQIFRIALGVSPGEVTAREAGELVGPGNGCLRALLAVGSARRRLDYLLPGFTRWLASRGELEPDERDYWEENLRALNVGSARLRAWLDTALLTIGRAPTALPPPAGTQDSEPYITAVTEIWAELGRDYALFSQERCVRALAKSLANGQEWAARKAQAAAVTDLTGRLLGYDREHVLAGVVGGGLTAVPAAKRWDFAREWLARARNDDPQVVGKGLLEALRTAEPGTEPSQLAGLCLRAHREGITAKQAYEQLAQSRALDSGAAAVRMLTALRQAFERSEVEFTDTYTWLKSLVRGVVRGAFGDTVGRDFRVDMSRAARDEIELQASLFIELVMAGREGHYEITEAERDDLVRYKDEFEFMAKKSRKPPSLWKRNANAGPAAQESG